MTLSGLAAGAPAAAARASTGFTVLDAVVIAVIILVVVLALIILTWRASQPAGRVQGLPWRISRTRRIQEAAAEDVAALRRDARLVRPDAPGNYPDEL